MRRNMDLEGKVIAVAGGTGMAGSAILRMLTTHRSDLRIRASCHTNAPCVNDPRILYVKADLASANDCRSLLQGADCAVMVAARTSGAAGSTRLPWDQITPNLSMYATFVQEAARSGTRRIVMVGSASLYQPFDGFIREDQLDLNLDPPDAYHGIGWVTRYIEKLCAFWHLHSPMQIVLVRAANIFGPFARFDPENSNFIPAIVRKAVDRMDPFVVWGSPQVTRDVIYADDFARAVVMLLEDDTLTFDVFNIGSGVPSTVREVVDVALSCAGHSPDQIRYDASAPSTIPFRGLDCTKARRFLGWEPAFSTAKGIEATTAWWKENKNTWTR